MTALCVLERAAPRLNSAKHLKLVAASLLISLVSTAPAPSAQPTVPDWQKAAGGKMEFEVASIRQNNGKFVPPNFAMNPPDDSYVPTGGLSIADYPVEVYIEFAYKFWPSNEQRQAMLAHLPKWVTADSLEIRARGPGKSDQDEIPAGPLGRQMHFLKKFAVSGVGAQIFEQRLGIEPGQPGVSLVVGTLQPCK